MKRDCSRLKVFLSVMSLLLAMLGCNVFPASQFCGKIEVNKEDGVVKTDNFLKRASLQGCEAYGARSGDNIRLDIEKLVKDGSGHVVIGVTIVCKEAYIDHEEGTVTAYEPREIEPYGGLIGCSLSKVESKEDKFIFYLHRDEDYKVSMR